MTSDALTKACLKHGSMTIDHLRSDSADTRDTRQSDTVIAKI
jgi:hypothetical protein